MAIQAIDLRLKFKQEPGNVLITDNTEVINESLSNLFNTRRGQRFFNRSFGSTITDLLFQPISEIIGEVLINNIQIALITFEPRVRLLIGQSEINPVYDQNLYDLRLVYEIIQTGETGQYNDFLRSELSNF